MYKGFFVAFRPAFREGWWAGAQEKHPRRSLQFAMSLRAESGM